MKSTLKCAAVAALLAACESNPTSTRPPGSLVADYSGYVSGRLQAEGRFRSRPGTTYATAYDLGNSQEGALHIGGEEYEGDKGESLVMTLSGAAPGEYSFAPDCDFDAARCAYGLFQIDTDTRDFTDPHSYEIVGGTITITAAQNGRLLGTFALQARQFDPQTLEYVLGTDVSFTGGTFDVPVVPLTRR